MTLKIDGAGRVVLPKPVRDRFGLKAGSDLEMQETADGVILRVVDQEPALVNRNGLLVHRGKLPKGYDWNRLVDDVREERLDKLGGR